MGDGKPVTPKTMVDQFNGLATARNKAKEKNPKPGPVKRKAE